MMHRISQHLSSAYHCYFTPFYATGLLGVLQNIGVMDFTIVGSRQRSLADEYMKTHGMRVDYGGRGRKYDLVVTCTDLIIQSNIKDKPIVLVQEGMTDPETAFFYVVKALRKIGFPRWVASTSTTGLSDAYQKFCVASDGYKNLFIRKGVRPEKIVVTGIPNYDNAKSYLENDLTIKNYVLVCTSDIRENFGFDNRRGFIRKVKQIAGNRQVVFKLHPNEKETKRREEIFSIIPDAIVKRSGNAHHLIANCDVLITQYSTLAYTALALNKEVHSYFDVNELRSLMPLQNGGISSKNIASQCKELLR